MFRFRCLLIAFAFVTFFCKIALADEISDIKSQIQILQAQIDEQQAVINAQSRQIDALHGKIENLEKKRKSKGTPSADITERVGVLEEKIEQKGNLNVNWKDGLQFASDDKQFDIKIGGRLHADYAWFSEESDISDKLGEIQDDGEIRRARFKIEGTAYKDFIYKLEYDFASGNADLKHAFLGLKNIPYVGTIKAGHFFEPFALESVSSTNYLTFIEHGLPSIFAPSRNTGFGINSTALDKRLSWAAGVFRNADSQGHITSNEHNFSTRVTGLPWRGDDGKDFWHIGASYSIRNPEETLQYRARPEANLAPYFVNTGSLTAHNAHLFAYETAAVLGPLSLQGEYVSSFVNRPGALSDAYFHGLYGYASYFLTGECRPYSTSSGTFSRVRPLKNFSVENGHPGAWEIALRYSWIDLTDEDAPGGIMSDITLGLNWYLNPNSKIMWNYIHSHLNGVGDADMALTRFQVDF